jgi:hypothetical protein
LRMLVVSVVVNATGPKLIRLFCMFIPLVDSVGTTSSQLSLYRHWIF